MAQRAGGLAVEGEVRLCAQLFGAAAQLAGDPPHDLEVAVVFGHDHERLVVLATMARKLSSRAR